MRVLTTKVEAIIDLDDLGPVQVRTLRLSELEAVREASANKPPIQFVLALVAACVVEVDTGEAVFTTEGWDVYCGAFREGGRTAIEAVMAANGMQSEVVAKN